MKNDANGLTNFDILPGVDLAVETLLGHVQRRRMESRLPKTERSRKKKERERAHKRKPNRINLNLPQDLRKRLEVLAKRERLPITQLVAFLLYEPLHLLETRVVSLWGYKVASHCPKFECTLDLKREEEEWQRIDDAYNLYKSRWSTTKITRLVAWADRLPAVSARMILEGCTALRTPSKFRRHRRSTCWALCLLSS